MGKSRRQRSEKACDSCAQSEAVLYRVKTGTDATWQFLCKSCQLSVANQKDYQYGGTWKQNKRN